MSGKMRFTDIVPTIEAVLEHHDVLPGVGGREVSRGRAG